MCKKEIIVEQFKDKPWTDKNTFGRNVTKDLSKSLFIMCGPVPARDVGIPTGYVPVRISVFMEYEVALPALVLSVG